MKRTEESNRKRSTGVKRYWDTLSRNQKKQRLSKHVIPTRDELVIRAHGHDGRKRWPQERVDNPKLHDPKIWLKFQYYREIVGVKNPEVLIEFFDRQICDVCGKTETAMNCVGTKPRALNIDHDHKTLVVRGALCNRCNNVLGRVDDDIELLANFIRYLEDA